jgi:hypothetical protein
MLDMAKRSGWKCICACAGTVIVGSVPSSEGRVSRGSILSCLCTSNLLKQCGLAHPAEIPRGLPYVDSNPKLNPSLKPMTFWQIWQSSLAVFPALAPVLLEPKWSYVVDYSWCDSLLRLLTHILICVSPPALLEDEGETSIVIMAWTR